MPVIIIALLAFVFQSSVQELNEQHFLNNCPYPILNGIATFGNPPFIPNTVQANRLNYTVTWNNNTHGSFFECHLDNLSNPHQGATIIIKNYGASTFGGAIPYGWYAWLGDSIVTATSKVQPTLTALYLYVQAPTIATGTMVFSYMNGFFVFCIGLGLFMVFRGVGS